MDYVLEIGGSDPLDCATAETSCTGFLAGTFTPSSVCASGSVLGLRALVGQRANAAPSCVGQRKSEKIKSGGQAPAPPVFGPRCGPLWALLLLYCC